MTGVESELLTSTSTVTDSHSTALTEVGQRAEVQRRHLARLVLRLCCAPFEVFRKWSDQFLGLANHDVICAAGQFPETAGNRTTNDCTYSAGTAPRQDGK